MYKKINHPDIVTLASPRCKLLIERARKGSVRQLHYEDAAEFECNCDYDIICSDWKMCIWAIKNTKNE